MKKIKLKLNKTKILGLPTIGLFLHIEQRHALAALTLDWYQEVSEQLAGEIELKLFVSSMTDTEVDGLITGRPVKRIMVPSGLSRGRSLNEGLAQLRDEGLDAVIPISAGDILTNNLIQSYGEHLKAGGLFFGLLDQYLFDPNALRCMHWRRGEVSRGIRRASELGLLFSANLLNELRWQLWPSTSDKGRDELHNGVMDRLEKVLSSAPPKTCLLKSMEQAGGLGFALKSEMARVLFDEENWQRLPGLNFTDFGIIFTETIGAEWLERFEGFDERIQVDILVEAPKVDADHYALWRDLYKIIPYKFDPYATVRVHVICAPEEVEEVQTWDGEWFPIPVEEGSTAQRWNQAINQLSAEDSELLCLGGIGSFLDLKTLEHYLIQVFKMGARYITLSNFFVAFSEDHRGHFWPGIPDLNFSRAFGLGTCVHKSYLREFGPSPLAEEGGLSPTANERFKALCAQENTRHQRVMYQCAKHNLGVVAFDPEGAIGFTDLIRLADLKTVRLSQHIPGPSYILNLRSQLILWEEGGVTEFQAPVSKAESSMRPEQRVDKQNLGETTMSQEMSPLERAKALLQKSQSSSAKQEVTDQSETSTTGGMSALERAKALLQKSRNPSEERATEQASSGENPTAAPSGMSALERAKALLQQSKKETPSPEAKQPETAPMSPLERAKALLQQSKGEATSIAQEVTDTTSEVIAHAVKNAEALVQHLEAKLSSVRAQVEEARADVREVEERAGADGPAELLCIQGEDAFERGDEHKSITLFESALMIDPTCIRALNNLGVIALHKDEPWRALSHFLMGLLQEPQNEDLAINLQGLFDLHPEMSTARAVIFE